MKNTLVALAAILFSYFIAELVFSCLVVNHIIQQKTYYYTEAVDPSGHIHFDPLIGYQMSAVPVRYGAVVSDGRLQAHGELKGNNYGLPDHRDFSPLKTDSSIIRVAVLGDSFTASQFTQRSWLKNFEDSLNRSLPDSIEMLNFSIDGGGLANWHAILKHIIVQDSFNIDAVIYAVLGDDMSRKLHYRHEYMAGDDGNYTPIRSVGVGYHDNWDERSYPRNLEEANMWFSDGWLVLSSGEVDAIESDNWKMSIPWNAYFLHELMNWSYIIIEQFVPKATATEGRLTNDLQNQIILEMRDMHELLHVPVMCFNLPASKEQQEEAKTFAKFCGADYLNEQDPNLETDVEWDMLAIEGDGHWTLAGADFFAKNNYDALQGWLESKKVINAED
jgi:hypothetical protein